MQTGNFISLLGSAGLPSFTAVLLTLGVRIYIGYKVAVELVHSVFVLDFHADKAPECNQLPLPAATICHIMVGET